MSDKKDLVQVIRDNPGCIAIIDSSDWALYRQHPHNNPHDADSVSAMDWDEKNLLADSNNTEPMDGLGGCRWGGDVFQALADIVGIEVENV
jgi:hypothetical protein